MAQDTVGYCSK